MVDFFETLPEYDAAMYTHKKMKTNTESSLEVLTELLPILEAQEDYSNDALYQTLVAYVEKKAVKWLCYVAGAHRSFRKADDACGRNGNHGSPWKGKSLLPVSVWALRSLKMPDSGKNSVNLGQMTAIKHENGAPACTGRARFRKNLYNYPAYSSSDRKVM